MPINCSWDGSKLSATCAPCQTFRLTHCKIASPKVKPQRYQFKINQIECPEILQGLLLNIRLLPLRVELKHFLAIAIPLSAAYLAEYAMFITTKMVVGKIGYHELAAVGIAGDLSFEILIIFMAMLSVVGVLVAQAEGGSDREQAGQSVRQGIFVATLIGVPAMIGIWNLDYVLIVTGQEDIVIELAIPYLKGLCGMALPVLWFAVFRNYIAALSQTVAVMVITLLAVLLNYVLTLWFVYGGGGLEPLGLFGAGLATTIVSWMMFFALLVHIFRKPALRGYGVFLGRWTFHRSIFREIFKLGIPVAALTLFEAGLFIATSILSGVIGAETLAAYEIVMAWVGIPFVIALGLSEATMVRVALAAGRQQPEAVRQSGLLGMTVVVMTTLLLAIVPVMFSDFIIKVFIDPEDPGFDLVSSLAAQFLVIAAIFQVFDGLQAAAARALRGLKDNIAPLWIAGFGYWVLGIGGGSLLAFHYGYEGGLWWGLAIGLFVTSNLLLWRFLLFTKRSIQAGAPR